jgi:hypothetical protein
MSVNLFQRSVRETLAIAFSGKARELRGVRYTHYFLKWHRCAMMEAEDLKLNDLLIR